MNMSKSGGEVNWEVEHFINTHGLDDKAAKVLRTSDLPVQQEVVQQGAFDNCQNPSSAVMWRIGQARKKLGVVNDRPLTKEKLCESWINFDGKCKFGERCFKAHGEHEIGLSNAELLSQNPNLNAPVTSRDVAEFISENKLDERAATDLMKADKDVQSFVINKGSLANAENPSAAVITRIAKKVREKKGETGGGGKSGGYGGGKSGGWGGGKGEGMNMGSMQQMMQMNMMLMNNMNVMMEMMGSASGGGGKRGKGGGKGARYDPYN